MPVVPIAVLSSHHTVSLLIIAALAIGDAGGAEVLYIVRRYVGHRSYFGHICRRVLNILHYIRRTLTLVSFLCIVTHWQSSVNSLAKVVSWNEVCAQQVTRSHVEPSNLVSAADLLIKRPEKKSS